MRGLIPRELLEHATDEELDEYVQFLAEIADAEDLDSGAWVLQPRQQAAEDALSDLDPTYSQELLYGGTAGPGYRMKPASSAYSMRSCNRPAPRGRSRR